MSLFGDKNSTPGANGNTRDVGNPNGARHAAVTTTASSHRDAVRLGTADYEAKHAK